MTNLAADKGDQQATQGLYGHISPREQFPIREQTRRLFLLGVTTYRTYSQNTHHHLTTERPFKYWNFFLGTRGPNYTAIIFQSNTLIKLIGFNKGSLQPGITSPLTSTYGFHSLLRGGPTVTTITSWLAVCLSNCWGEWLAVEWRVKIAHREMSIRKMFILYVQATPE